MSGFHIEAGKDLQIFPRNPWPGIMLRHVPSCLHPEIPQMSVVCQKRAYHRQVAIRISLLDQKTVLTILDRVFQTFKIRRDDGHPV